MMKVSVQVINSFSIGATGGNPAGVVITGRLNDQQKQLVATKAGLSETVYISNSDVADFKLDFYTPTRQIAHCGHATIAAFWYLRSLKKVNADASSKETIDGTRKIIFRGTEPFLEQRTPQFSQVQNPNDVLRSLGLNSETLPSNFSPLIGNTGNSFILVQVNNFSDLTAINADFDKIFRISSDNNAIGYYVFAMSSDRSIIQTRMFAPLYGINEESATGMAAGPLACLLYSGSRKKSFEIFQGKYMTHPSESKIKVELNTVGESVTTLYAGGSAYISSSLEVTI